MKSIVRCAHDRFARDRFVLIPELVDHLDYHLGVSHAAIGDFGSAGGAEFHLRRTLDQPFATLATGANGLARLALGGSTPGQTHETTYLGRRMAPRV